MPETTLEFIAQRLKAIQDEQHLQRRRFDILEQRFSVTDSRLAAIEDKLDRIIDKLEQR